MAFPEPRLSIVDKIVAVHLALSASETPHGFGGALALAWCTQQARGTIDIDINIFLNADAAATVFEVLPEGVIWDTDDLEIAMRDGQVRLWWDQTPLDVFLNTTPFHHEVAARVRYENFAGHSIPFLNCNDLAVFKAFFNRTKDWADLEEMLATQTLDLERVLGVLAQHLGGDDERVTRLIGLSI